MEPSKRLRVTTGLRDDPGARDFEADLLAEIGDLVAELRAKPKPEADRKHISLPVWLVAIIVGVIVSTSGTAVASLIALNNRVNVIESTRFTHASGVEMESRMRAYHDMRTPPPEVLQRLMEHERRLTAQSDRLLRLEQRGGN